MPTMMEWFFPEQAEAAHLRSISRTLSRQSGRSRRDGGKSVSAEAVEGLEEDMGVLALVLLSLVHKLVDKGLLTREELFDHLAEVDALDGTADGQLDMGVLRGALGLVREAPAREEEDDDDRKRVRRSRRRR